MIRNALLLSLAFLLFSVSSARAGSSEDCLHDCAEVRIQCLEAITLFDETGVKEAKAVCAAEEKACKERCREDDARNAEDAEQAKRVKEAEEGEQKRKERRETLNGTINMITFD